jgi:hypothetical protein
LGEIKLGGLFKGDLETEGIGDAFPDARVREKHTLPEAAMSEKMERRQGTGSRVQVACSALGIITVE